MFKKLLLVLCISSVYAQDAKKLPPLEPEVITYETQCFDTDVLFGELRRSYREVPLATGKADDEAESIMSIWIHPTLGTWSIIATKNSLSCVIGYGKEFNVVPYPRGKSL